VLWYDDIGIVHLFPTKGYLLIYVVFAQLFHDNGITFNRLGLNAGVIVIKYLHSIIAVFDFLTVNVL